MTSEKTGFTSENRPRRQKTSFPPSKASPHNHRKGCGAKRAAQFKGYPDSVNCRQ